MAAVSPWHLGRNSKSLTSHYLDFRLSPLLSLCLPKSSALGSSIIRCKPPPQAHTYAWRERSPILRLKDGCRVKSFSLCHQLRALSGPLTASTPFESPRSCQTCHRLRLDSRTQLDLRVQLQRTAFFGCSRSASCSSSDSWRTTAWSSCYQLQFPVYLVVAELAA